MSSEKMKKATNMVAGWLGKGLAAYEKGCGWAEGKIAGKDGFDGKLDKLVEKISPATKSATDKVATATKKVAEVTKEAATAAKNKVVETGDKIKEAVKPKQETVKTVKPIEVTEVVAEPVKEAEKPLPVIEIVSIREIDPRMVFPSKEILPPKYKVATRQDLKPGKVTLKGKVKSLFTKPMVKTATVHQYQVD